MKNNEDKLTAILTTATRLMEVKKKYRDHESMGSKIYSEMKLIEKELSELLGISE